MTRCRLYAPLLALFGVSTVAGTLVGCRGETVAPEPLTMAHVIDLAESGASAEDIIREIDETRAIYILSADDVIRLHDAGVDSRVIDHMLETHRTDLRRRAEAGAPPPPAGPPPGTVWWFSW